MPVPHPHTIDRTRVFANIAYLEREGIARNRAIAEAFNEARAAYFKRYPKGLLPQWLTYRKDMRSAVHYLASGAPIGRNPVQSSPVARAGRLYKQFTGDAPTERVKVSVPGAGFTVGFIVGSVLAFELDIGTLRFSAQDAAGLPALAVSHDGRRVVLIGGDYGPLSPFLDNPVILSIMYETVRDGEAQKYRHPFAKHARPALQVIDARNAKMNGGSFRFTDRGFVDSGSVNSE